MIDDQLPLPEPRGALVPSVRHPPTAIGLSTPPPAEPHAELARSRRPLLWRVVYEAMNALDHVGDAVAHALRVR